MALLICVDCGGPVSDLALACPRCGRPRRAAGGAQVHVYRAIEAQPTPMYAAPSMAGSAYDAPPPQIQLAGSACHAPASAWSSGFVIPAVPMDAAPASSLAPARRSSSMLVFLIVAVLLAGAGYGVVAVATSGSTTSAPQR